MRFRLSQARRACRRCRSAEIGEAGVHRSPSGTIASQELVRITRTGDDDFEQEDIAEHPFVPLIGKEIRNIEMSEQ